MHLSSLSCGGASESTVELRALCSALSRAALFNSMTISTNLMPLFFIQNHRNVKLEGEMEIPLSPTQRQYTLNLVMPAITTRCPMSHDVTSYFPQPTRRTSSRTSLLASPFRDRARDDRRKCCYGRLYGRRDEESWRCVCSSIVEDES